MSKREFLFLYKFIFTITFLLSVNVLYSQMQFLPSDSSLSEVLEKQKRDNTVSSLEDLSSLNKVSVNDLADTAKFTIPVQRQLSVVLSNQGWVLDAASSILSEGKDTTKSIVLRSLREEPVATVFLFTRDTVGSNTLVFKRNDLENSEQQLYKVIVTWVNDANQTQIQMNKSVYGIIASIQRDEDFEYVDNTDGVEENTADQKVESSKDEVKPAVAVSKKEQAQVPAKKRLEKEQDKQSSSSVSTPQNIEQEVEVPPEESAQTAIGTVINDIDTQNNSANNDERNQLVEESSNVPSTQEADTVVLDRNESQDDELNDENEDMNVEVPMSSFVEVEQRLAVIKKLFAEKEYERANKLLDMWILDPLTDDSMISQGLFDIAKMLQDNPENIEDIEIAIKMYERIIDEYPLSLFFYDAIQNMLFLQENYISIR